MYGTYFKSDADPHFVSVSGSHKLFGLIYKYASTKLKERYNYLRSDILSENNIIYMFSNFMASIPKSLKDEEVKLYPLLPSTDTNNLSQIVMYYANRCKYMDNIINNL
jgi:hypothetical protein